MGLVLPEEGFLEFLREITKDHGSLLIFDEVITGFRLSLGGAQQYYNIKPDITTLGKLLVEECRSVRMAEEEKSCR